ncbi:hypothetical protein STEG23_007980 [Scotinomys teguina]
MGESAFANEILRQLPGESSGDAFFSFNEERAKGNKERNSPALCEMLWDFGSGFKTLSHILLRMSPLFPGFTLSIISFGTC